jgi:Na+/proline symporter
VKLAKWFLFAVAVVAVICWAVTALGYPTEAFVLGWIGVAVIFFAACELFFN